MAGESSEHTDLITLDFQIDELKQRMACLQERMATMTSQQYETRNQSVLLSTMQEVLRDLHLLRLEILAVPAGGDVHPAPAYLPDGHGDMIHATRPREAQLGAR
ncbi:hypothetical protein [Noviherbaspirillum soli]|uniref:hypothetical protein n=1 Tax=Noviherbaspirillum soli TaxID=1064518 RepID=UPI00188CE8CE|nr:hypothetical protein [Noviherbaspirillum soli]